MFISLDHSKLLLFPLVIVTDFFSIGDSQCSILLGTKTKKQVQRGAAKETAPAVLSVFFDFRK